MRPGAATDLVPVGDRLPFLRWLRVAVVVAVLAAALTGAAPLFVAAATLVATSGVYLMGLLAVDEWWRRRARRGFPAAGAGLLVDGLYLAWVGAVTGGTDGVAPFLVLGHVAAVTVLVSYRTGVKVALWHSLLVYGAFQLNDLGYLATTGLGAAPLPRAVAYIGVLWLVAVGTASFSAVNERELRRRRADLEALAALATALEEALATDWEEANHPRGVAEVLADRLREAFGFPRLVLLGGQDAMRVLAGAGLATDDASVPPATAASVLRRACAQRRTLLVSHLPAAEDPGVAAVLPGARNLLVVPLGAVDGAVDVVVAEYGEGRGARIEQRVVSAVERFVDHGALALRTARLLDEVRTLATIDGLTEVTNRRGFDAGLREELARVARFDQPLALLLLDIDHFKPVNDVHGHQVGDVVLRGVAQTLVAVSRPFDTVARYGGEEFAVLAPRADARAALEIAERLRTAVEQATLAVSVTVSLGVAVATPDGIADPDTLFKAADEALSISKRTGRNRATMA